MFQQLHCRLRRRYPIALLAVTGQLRLDTASRLRSAVLKALAEQPLAMVLDLRRMKIGDHAAVSIFPALAQHSACSGSIALLLATDDPELLAVLHDRGIHDMLDIRPNVSEALDVASTRPLPNRQRVDFEPVDSAAMAARAAVGEACERWGLSLRRQRAVQVASELVSNAVEHARTPGVLLVTRRDSLLHISVRDGSQVRPRLRPAGSDGGYGLLLVQRLSAGWGTHVVPDGKVVWASLRIGPELALPSEQQVKIGAVEATAGGGSSAG
jgi:anti-anti-sigma regulatory factor